MTKRELLRRAALENALVSLGFTTEEADKLRRISLILTRWYELECGMGEGHREWSIERDDESGKPYMVTHIHGKAGTRTFRHPIADREAGALRRLKTMMEGRPLFYYVQSDPRGHALHILRSEDLRDGAKLDECYSRGLAVF